MNVVGSERVLYAILPGDVHDPTSPSGGNVYDRRACRDLVAVHGWQVHESAIPGSWPRPDGGSRTALTQALASVPDGAVVLLDGLVACGVPDIVAPQAHRLRIVVLVHLPLADEHGLAPDLAEELDAREQTTLRAASAIVVTSTWTARRLAERGIAAHRVHIAAPGSDSAPLADGTDGASRLLCVAAVTPHKGHDLLVDALASVADLPWTCGCAGALHRAPAHLTRIREQIERNGLDDRVRVLGPLPEAELAAAYASTDLVVLPSRGETYGMVVTEALQRGIPVLATAVGAVRQTLGHAPDGSVPGLLVPPNDAAMLGTALRRWLSEPDLRRKLRASANSVRGMLAGWDATVRSLDAVLDPLRGAARP